jgi:hypothetical protein
MVESMVGKRGQEKGFLINAKPNFDYRNDTGAKSIIEDYILCRGCEQRMAYVEAYICFDYRDKIKNNQFKQNFKTEYIENLNYRIVSSQRVNPTAFMLFICTIIFRLSISKNEIFLNFELRAHEAEHLREIINELLPTYENFKVKIKLANWLRAISSKSKLLEGLYHITATYSELSDRTRAVIMAHPEYRQPYNFILNQFIVLFFFRKPRKTEQLLDYFDLLINIDSSLLLNNSEDVIKTVLVSEEKWEAILTKVKTTLVRQKSKSLMEHFLKDFKEKNGRDATQEDYTKFLQEMYPEN